MRTGRPPSTGGGAASSANLVPVSPACGDKRSARSTTACRTSLRPAAARAIAFAKRRRSSDCFAPASACSRLRYVNCVATSARKAASERLIWAWPSASRARRSHGLRPRGDPSQTRPRAPKLAVSGGGRSSMTRLGSTFDGNSLEKRASRTAPSDPVRTTPISRPNCKEDVTSFR